MKYEKLFSAGKIGRVRLRNRVVMPAMMVSYNEPGGEASERLIKYFEERAAGGVGLIIVNGATVPAYGKLSITVGCGHRDYIRSLELLTRAVHRHGAKIFVQISPMIAGKAVSNVPTVPGMPAPEPVSLEEIKYLEKTMADSAAIAVEAGFDGIEIHSAHGHFMGQFLSNYYNKRTDEYGGCFENRVRFLTETINAVRGAVGPAVPVVVRISGDEFASHISPDCLTLEDGIQLAKYLDSNKLVDAIDVSNSNNFNPNANCEPYSYTPGWKKHVAKAIKEVVSVPVIATNTIKTAAFAEQLLEEGVSDFVGVGRGNIADPEFVRKAFEGRENEVRQCIGCMYCRETQLSAKSVPMRCSVNPRLGLECMFPAPVKDGNGRTVVVAGSGPAGMQAAVVLAQRAFHTVLLEQRDKLGGTLNLADKPAHKENIETLINTLTVQMEKAGVEIHLNTEATVEEVKKYSPCGVILASGARPIRPGVIPGINRENVHTAEETIMNELELPGKVVVVGSGMTGLETAELLASKGSEITIVEMLPNAGPGLYPIILNDIMGRLLKFSPTILTSHKLVGIDENGVIAEDMTKGEKVVLEADHVVLSLGVAPREDLVAEFEANFSNVVAVGDAAKGGRIHQAISTGYAAAYSFDPWN